MGLEIKVSPKSKLAGHFGDLKQYVIDLVTVVGGITEERDETLLEIALPPDLACQNGIPELLTLAFNSEVAAETPGTELLTFGSPLLDKLLLPGLAIGRVTKKFAIVPGVRIPPNLLERINSRISFERSRRPSVCSTAIESYESVWFQYMVTYISDEKFSDSTIVAVDAGTLADDTAFLPELKGVFLSDNSELAPKIPPAASYSYPEIFRTAAERLKVAARPQFRYYQAQAGSFCRVELAKVLHYYQVVLHELAIREKNAADPEKKARLQAKIATANAERERRITDVVNKYRLTAQARLDSIMIVVLPKIKVKLELQHKEDLYYPEIYYNLATNSVEPLSCPRCGARFTVAYPAADGTFVCSPEEAGRQ
jgi:hypothetical protein